MSTLVNNFTPIIEPSEKLDSSHDDMLEFKFRGRYLTTHKAHENGLYYKSIWLEHALISLWRVKETKLSKKYIILFSWWFFLKANYFEDLEIFHTIQEYSTILGGFACTLRT